MKKSIKSVIPKKPRSKSRSSIGKSNKLKGSAFERTVAKRFAEWWSAVNPEAIFKRTPQSGGGHLAEEFLMSGDIMCTDTRFPFHIECKNRQDWTYQLLFQNKGNPIGEWWEQAISKCPKHLIPLVIFTKKYEPTYAVVPVLWDGTTPLANIPPGPLLTGLCSSAGRALCILTLEDLLRFSPDFFSKDIPWTQTF